jgi:hypothetical protein
VHVSSTSVTRLINMQLSDYNFPSVACEKIASSLTSDTIFSSCSNTGSIRDDSYWTFGENSLELIELPSIKKLV